MEKTIAINAGSSTLKFKLFEMPEEKVISSGTVDRIGIPGSNFTIKTTDGKKVEIDQPIKNHEEAVNLLLKELLKLDIIKDYSEITGVGHRVVAGGEIFQDSALIDDKVLKQIEDLKEYAPLHNPANATGIRAFRRFYQISLVWQFLIHLSMKRYLKKIIFTVFLMNTMKNMGLVNTVLMVLVINM